jgi:large subunit ribosomal protein L23
MSRPAHQERLTTVILGPHVSEKTTAAADKRHQVVFKVRLDASKREIRQAVEMLFEVKVDRVTVVRILGKIKRHGLTRGRQASWKKAYVRLAPGNDISFMGAE